MKKGLLFLFVVAGGMFFSSCKKECTCTITMTAPYIGTQTFTETGETERGQSCKDIEEEILDGFEEANAIGAVAGVSYGIKCN